MGQRLGVHDVPGGQLDPRGGYRGCAVRRAVGVAGAVDLVGGGGGRCARGQRGADRHHGGGAQEGPVGSGGAYGGCPGTLIGR